MEHDWKKIVKKPAPGIMNPGEFTVKGEPEQDETRCWNPPTPHSGYTAEKYNDPVDHPAHYTSSAAQCECGRRIECIDVVRHMGFNLGNIVKYLWRADLKNGLEDLKKAAWYLNDLIEQKERE